eukprot:3493089-Rhodomonas_salina.3
MAGTYYAYPTRSLVPTAQTPRGVRSGTDIAYTLSRVVARYRQARQPAPLHQVCPSRDRTSTASAVADTGHRLRAA